MNNDKTIFSDKMTARVRRGASDNEQVSLRGVFTARCIGPDGVEKWRDTIQNTIMTLGKDAVLDAALAGSGYTVTGPYMGLISSVGYSSVPVAADTMASHASWVEAGSASNFPLYNGTRKTVSWSASSGGVKATSATVNFVIETTGGTAKGCFIVFGSGASATIANTSGTLFCAGLFTNGDKVVGVGDTIEVTYSVTAT